MDKLTLPVTLINAILQYFGTKPYAEVVNLVSAIQNEANAQIPAEFKDSAES